jgi:LysM repeat protein
MLKKLALFLLVFSSSSVDTFSQEIVDTLYTSHGTVILYENKTWQYLEDIKFNGVMNEHLHCMVADHPDLAGFKQAWDNQATFTSHRSNDISQMKDTLWMCVLKDIDDEFVIPVKGIVTSRYGPRGRRHHNGIDLDLETGDSVVAAWSGRVRYAKFNEGGFGNLVIIRHDNGLETFYAHLSKISVGPNQVVKAGEAIGLGGNTGRSYGSHLHFEVRFYDLPMNPEEVIDFTTKNCRDENLFVHKGLFRPGAKPSHLNTAPANNNTATAATIAPATSNTNKYYKVRSGDTLSSIAAKNRTTISKLCQLNGIRQTTILQVGRNLRVR